MKKFAPLTGVILLVCLSSTVMANLYVETFNTSNAGWTSVTVNDSGGNTYPAPTYNSIGGNPDGNISGVVSTATNRLYGLQPSSTALYGNLTGTKMTVDFKVNGTVTGPTPHLVRFFVGTYTGGYNYFVTNTTYSWDPNADTSWTTHQVTLDAANFVIWPNQNAGTKAFAQVIAAPEDIGLVFADNFVNNQSLGFSSTGGATISIDNFGTVVPEPATLGMLLLGSVSFFLNRRRSQA